MGLDGVLAYRCFVLSYACVLPLYFYYRFCHSILPPLSWLGCYQWVTCCLELYGACNVLLLGFIRFRVPWAPAAPKPPAVPFFYDAADVEDEGGSRSGRDSGPFDVAILVPCYSEPDDVIFGTIRAALALSDPLASRVRVVLCDDAGRPARAERLERLSPASHGRALYVSRPKDPSVPRHGKAGNLNYALRTVLYPHGAPPSPNALIVVFDCDMEAHGDFLQHTLPYFATQPNTALVQTPQTFYNVVPAADIFNHHNLTFYQAMQPGLDAWGATVCCGTNFVARSVALHGVGYFPTESITEDYLLSLKLATAGWTVRFHAACVCTGEAPEDLRQVFKQRNRWCCGCFQVFLHPNLPRWLFGLARRSPIKAICWINAPLSYLGTLLTVPLWAAVPALSLYSNVHPVKAITPALVALWLGYFYLLVLLTEMMPSRLNRLSAAFLGSKCNAIFWYCFAQALVEAIIGRLIPAKAKQFEVTEKRGFSADADLRRAVAPGGLPSACGGAAGEASAGFGMRLGGSGGSGGSGGGGGGGASASGHEHSRLMGEHVGSHRASREGDETPTTGVAEAEAAAAEAQAQAMAAGEEEEPTGSTAEPALALASAIAKHSAQQQQQQHHHHQQAGDHALAVRGASSANDDVSSSPAVRVVSMAVAAEADEAEANDDPPRDSSQVDVVFHQLVLSAEMLLLVAGLLHRAFGPTGGAHGGHAGHGGGGGGGGNHHHILGVSGGEEDGGNGYGSAGNDGSGGGGEGSDYGAIAAEAAAHAGRLLLAQGSAGGSGGGGGLGFWQQLGLVLVPAAWLLINMIPHCMALAYAYLPHAHRVQSSAVGHALRTHSLLLFFVSLAMVQAAFLHWLSAPQHGHHAGGGGGGHHIGADAAASYLPPSSSSSVALQPPAFSTRAEAEAYEQQLELQQQVHARFM